MPFQEMSVELKRECQASLIPSGEKILLPLGTHAYVTQALGTAYSIYVHGNLLRVEGSDGDALGLAILETPDVNLESISLEEKIELLLQTCFDPEIPVNILDLGLIYDSQLIPLGGNEFQAHITMTLTAPGCGMGPVLVDEVKNKIASIKEIKEVIVNLVFDPPWDRNKMSESAKLQLGLL